MSIIITIVFGIILFYVNKNSAEDLPIRKEPIRKSTAYWLWVVGGFWGLHRAKLCVKKPQKWHFTILFKSRFLFFAIGALTGILSYLLFIFIIPWMLFDLFWISYRVYRLNGLYYRRSPEELDILQGKETEVDKFYHQLGVKLDIINDVSFKELLARADEVMARQFEPEKGLIGSIKSYFERDGSLEFEQDRLSRLISLAGEAADLNVKAQLLYQQSFYYLAKARIAAYRNLYLAKELIAQIKEMRGKSQDLQLDEFKTMETMRIDINPAVLSEVKLDMNEAVENFGKIHKSLSNLGMKGSTATAVSGGLALVGAVIDNIDKRQDQKQAAVKAQAKIVDGLKQAGSEMAKLSGETLRVAEKMSALYEANKAFIHAYSHLRDTVFGEVRFKNWIKGVNRKNPAFRSESFLRDVQHLVLVCSEYNKINQAK